jgi:hypothetical protein
MLSFATSWLLFILGSTLTVDGTKTAYRRPPPAEMLPLDDPRLTKTGGAHDPEQILVALAGPGIAISWVTHPQVRLPDPLPLQQPDLGSPGAELASSRAAKKPETVAYTVPGSRARRLHVLFGMCWAVQKN